MFLHSFSLVVTYCDGTGTDELFVSLNYGSFVFRTTGERTRGADGEEDGKGRVFTVKVKSSLSPGFGTLGKTEVRIR